MAESERDILAHEFSDKFVAGMKGRMIVSFFKYGRLDRAYPEKVHALESLKQRIAKYEETGNTEWLMDVANFAMIEYMFPRHHLAHFEATGSEASPGRITIFGEVTDKDNGLL